MENQVIPKVEAIQETIKNEMNQSIIGQIITFSCPMWLTKGMKLEEMH